MIPADGHYDLPPGKIALVITHLEMRAARRGRDVELPQGWRLEHVKTPATEWYRDLMRKVGADWLWFKRLQASEASLAEMITHPDVAIWTLRSANGDAAIAELDYRKGSECELVFFGLAPELIGLGAGRALMNHVIDEAFARPIVRLRLTTCTLDSPQALEFYLRSGFCATGRSIEIVDDPRLDGTLDKKAAPHIPIV